MIKVSQDSEGVVVYTSDQDVIGFDFQVLQTKYEFKSEPVFHPGTSFRISNEEAHDAIVRFIKKPFYWKSQYANCPQYNMSGEYQLVVTEVLAGEIRGEDNRQVRLPVIQNTITVEGLV